jgi:hypothetical protein
MRVSLERNTFEEVFHKRFRRPTPGSLPRVLLSRMERGDPRGTKKTVTKTRVICRIYEKAETEVG